MVDQAKSFQHLALKLSNSGRVQTTPGGRSTKNPRSLTNAQNTQNHGSSLQNSASNVIADWNQNSIQRKQKNKPELPESIPLVLQIDPQAFEPENLRQYGIEVISELEDGYIIGASVDSDLSDLQKKIQLFIHEEYGGKKVAEIWEILDGTKRPDYILSPSLLEKWDQIHSDETYIVDVGVACIGTKSQLPNCPQRKNDEPEEKYLRRFQRWSDKRDLTYQEWDDLADHRDQLLSDFVEQSQGTIISPRIDGKIATAAQLPDSFTCRVSLSGNALKDLVLNFPYVFEVVEPDLFLETINRERPVDDQATSAFSLDKPQKTAPKVCIIDSGIQEGHVLLKEAIDSQNSKSWVPGEIQQVSDHVSGGGHGTRVAGAVLYPNKIPKSGQEKAVCWLQNARVLDANCQLPTELFPPHLITEITSIYYQNTKTRIFNHSITASVPCPLKHMSAWAAEIDKISWEKDILFIVSAGNLPMTFDIGNNRLSVRTHLSSQRTYPNYLLEKSCRVANPAQSLQALTVGSIASKTFHKPPYYSISKKNQASAFSCSGLGIWNTIKPEVVEYGGDFSIDESNPPNITQHKEVCPELVRATMDGGPAFARDQVGTSFSAPKVSHIAAKLADLFPKESCLLYRALIVQSARWPSWTTNMDDKLGILRQIGYGIPNINRALENSPNRITLFTQGLPHIKAREAHIYQVNIPPIIQSQGDEIEILVEVCLSYKAQPRRTRRNRRKYLSTWLDWECSKKGENSDSFLERMLKEHEASDDAEKGEGIFSWALRNRNNHGEIRDVSRNSGTIQKDWATIKSFNLRDSFCIAVVGHQGWNNDPDAQVPYSLVVSFEALQSHIPIYTEFSQVQVEPLKVEQQTQIQVKT